MFKFPSKQKAQEIIHKAEAQILSLIEKDLIQANCNDISLDNWMGRFSKNKNMQEKYHTLSALEIALINAQQFVEHQAV